MTDEIKALLIQMRQYVAFHGLMIGECVAWGRLKEMSGTGVDWDAEGAWLKDYRRREAAKEGPCDD